MANTHVLIVGAGLGGLTAALCLARRGFRVTVLEQADELGEIGAGVQISANGARVLHWLDLADALDAVAFRPERGEMRDGTTGDLLLTRPLGKTSEERFGFPYYHLHRADLHAVLVAALRAVPGVGLRLSSKVIGCRAESGAVTAMLCDGSSIEADVLVGCDGIHSVIRASLFGLDEPRFTGCVAWRATVPTERLPHGLVRPVAANWLGQGGHFVHYYLRRGELVNCVGVQERAEWRAESWSSKGDPRGFLEDFAEWHADLRTLIAQVDSCYTWGLFDRDPLSRWSQGGATLLGDACHPMLPFMAQGAVMAIEDAFTLAGCLAACEEPVMALQRYEALRKERTAVVQRMSRGNVEIFHNPHAGDLAARLDKHKEAHLWLYGFDVTAQDFAGD